MSSDKNIQWSLDVFHQHHTIVSIHYLIPFKKKKYKTYKQNSPTQTVKVENFQDLQHSENFRFLC